MACRLLQSVDHLHSLSPLRLAHAICILYLLPMQSCQGHLSHCKSKAFFPCMCECVSMEVCVCVSLSGFLVNTKSIFSITFFVFRQTFRPSPISAAIAFSRHVCVEYFSQILFWFCFLGVKLSKMHRKTTTIKKNKFDGKLQFG